MGRKIAPLHVIQEDKKKKYEKTKTQNENDKTREIKKKEGGRGNKTNPNKASFLQPWPRKRTQARSRTREWQNPGTTFKSELTTMGKS